MASARSDCHGRMAARRSTWGLHSQDLAELTSRSGTRAARSRANVPTTDSSQLRVVPRQCEAARRIFTGCRNVERGGQQRLLADHPRREDLRDVDAAGVAAVHFAEGEAGIGRAEIDPQNVLLGHGVVLRFGWSDARKCRAPWRGRARADSSPAGYRTSTSIGVMTFGPAGSTGRVKRGRASFEVFQPRCTTTPAYGGSCRTLPSRR